MRLLLLFAALCFSIPASAQVSATIDRFIIQANGTVKLTLESDQKSVISPDLSPLYEDFQILGSKKMTISSNTGDGRQFSARWQVIMRPKRGGSLTIPALQIGSEKSPELIITVASRNNRNQRDEFGDENIPGSNADQSTLELLADSTELYVGSQLTLTLRLLFRDKLAQDIELPAPQIAGAVVKKFGDQIRRQSVRRGQAFNVVEQGYLVFPTQSGRLQIPEQVFSTIHNGVNLQVISQPLIIDVLPEAFQKNRGYWLPSAQVTVEDNLTNPFLMEVGQAVDRTITLTAVGVTAESLPALSSLRNELANLEVIDVSLFEEFTDQGIQSTRQETIRVTPYERGEVTLRPITIPWWNTSLDRSEEALLDARIIQVIPATVVEQPESNPITEEQEPLDNEDQPQLGQISDTSSSDQSIWGYVLLAVGAVIAIVIAIFGLIKFKEWKSMNASEEDFESDEEIAFQALSMACVQNNAELAQQALLLWAQHYWQGYSISSNSDISELAGSETFDILISDLEEHVEENSAYWRGDLLLDACTMLRGLQEA